MAVKGTIARVYEAEAPTTQFPDYLFRQLLGPEDGTLAGCCCGILEYTQQAYNQGGIHEDQECFYVLNGTGTALVGEEEFPLRPGDCFHVPPHHYHAIKRDESCPHIRLFFFHAAV